MQQECIILKMDVGMTFSQGNNNPKAPQMYKKLRSHISYIWEHKEGFLFYIPGSVAMTNLCHSTYAHHGVSHARGHQEIQKFAQV